MMMFGRRLVLLEALAPVVTDMVPLQTPSREGLPGVVVVVVVVVAPLWVSEQGHVATVRSRKSGLAPSSGLATMRAQMCQARPKDPAGARQGVRATLIAPVKVATSIT